MTDRFPNLNTYKSDKIITEEFRLKWVTPYYLNLGKTDEEWINKVRSIKKEITSEIMLKCLGDRGWRSRQTGAYFAAINNSTQLTEIIGTHFLKSEVCYAGKQYAVTLAKFNTKTSIEYLKEYLDYYLKHPELEFDQIQVFEALKFVDESNQTNHLESFKKQWTRFCQINIGKFEKIVLVKNEIGSPEYQKAMKRIREVWNYNRPSTYVSERIETISKIIQES